MKKLGFLFGLLALTAAVVFAQNTVLPCLAVVEFSTSANTDKAKTDAVTVREIVESEMVKTRKFQIVIRDEIDKLLESQRIQVQNISSSENIKKLDTANIKYIVTGSLSSMGNDYVITVRMLDVSAGQFSHSENDFMGSAARDLYNGINSLMIKFLAGMSVTDSRVAAQESSGTGKTYNIGDTGPAGGFVFYDKGNYNDGWRYLEAAPADKEFTAQWGAYDKDVSGTLTGIGTGKRNTQIIMEFLKSINETGKAVQRCTQLNINGFNDWFLPSKDELDLMYRYLKQRGIGSLKNELYWSSSQSNKYYSWYQRFSDGFQYNFNFKIVQLFVRAVRSF